MWNWIKDQPGTLPRRREHQPIVCRNGLPPPLLHSACGKGPGPQDAPGDTQLTCPDKPRTDLRERPAHQPRPHHSVTVRTLRRLSLEGHKTEGRADCLFSRWVMPPGRTRVNGEFAGKHTLAYISDF